MSGQDDMIKILSIPASRFNFYFFAGSDDVDNGSIETDFFRKRFGNLLDIFTASSFNRSPLRSFGNLNQAMVITKLKE